MQYCISLKNVVQTGISGHMYWHGEFSNHQIPTFVVKMLDNGLMLWSILMVQNTFIINENNWHHFGFSSHLTYFSVSKRKRSAA
jgi:hypothetical protein